MIFTPTDSLVRRIRLSWEDFFQGVEIKDATRAPYDIDTKIELPDSFRAHYFPEGQEVDFLVRDMTVNRLLDQRFDLSLMGDIFYRNIDKIRITLGGPVCDGNERRELRKMEKYARPSECGLYLIAINSPVPFPISS